LFNPSSSGGKPLFLTCSFLTQLDEVRSGGSYISQNDLKLHFGLIQMRWPSGAVDTLTNVTANKVVTVKEGKGLVE